MNDIALKYSTALYEIALENKCLDVYQDQIKTLISLLEDNEEFLSVLSSSFISVDEKTKIINQTLKDFENDIVSFIKIIVNNHRVDILFEILDSFNSLVNQYKGITEGLLYSAFPLDKETIKTMEDALTKKEGRKVSLKEKVDPSLIGGVKIVINNRVYDGSLKNKLAEMKRSLMYKED